MERDDLPNLNESLTSVYCTPVRCTDANWPAGNACAPPLTGIGRGGSNKFGPFSSLDVVVFIRHLVLKFIYLHF